MEEKKPTANELPERLENDVDAALAKEYKRSIFIRQDYDDYVENCSRTLDTDTHVPYKFNLKVHNFFFREFKRNRKSSIKTVRSWKHQEWLQRRLFYRCYVRITRKLVFKILFWILFIPATAAAIIFGLRGITLLIRFILG